MPVPTGVDAFLFLDETGTPNYFNAKKLAEIQAQQEAGVKITTSTMFGLAGVLMRRRDYQAFARDLNALKQRHFGTHGFSLHEYELRRAKGGPFNAVKDFAAWQAFYADLDAVFARTDFRVIVATVDKYWMQQQYPTWQYNAYQYTLHVIVERVINEKAFGTTCRIVAESRETGLNRDLTAELLRLQFQGGTIDGRETVTADEVRSRIHPNILFRTKKDLNAGLEAADLAAGPTTRWLYGLPTNPPHKDLLPIVQPKFRRSRTGQVRGYGVICLPGFPTGCPCPR